jgi:hypothetical protein
MIARLLVLSAFEGLLWLLPARVTRTLLYAPFLAFLLIPGIPLGLQIGIALAIIHGIIHHIWPFLGSNGYDPRHTPFYDVTWHTVMMLYAHYYFADRFVVLSWLVEAMTLLMLACALLNCWLAWKCDKLQHPRRARWFELTTVSQAYSSGYVIFAMLFFGCASGPQLTWMWLAFIAAYLGFWNYFLILDRRDKTVVARFFDRAYFEFSFIVPAYVSALFYLLLPA